MAKRTCFAQHDRITTNTTWCLNQNPDNVEKFRQKLKPKNLSQSLVAPAAAGLLPLVAKIVVGGRWHGTLVEANAAAADYIIYFKQLSQFAKATKQTFSRK